ncbi:MAG: M23 family metallopeptidase [Anaerolineae bacterium]|nr:M23 family metallopeptidase [Anaerolineae bacterium]
MIARGFVSDRRFAGPRWWWVFGLLLWAFGPARVCWGAVPQGVGGAAPGGVWALCPGVERPLLSRPVGEGAAHNTVDRFYPYASTGQGRYQVHHGVEFVNPAGTPVVAAAAGRVVVAGTDEREVWGRHPGYYGQLVVVELAQPYRGMPVYLLYGHLSRVEVRLGQVVAQGKVLGAVGSSGVALGPHLHFEVRVGDNTFAHTRNPELWLAPLPGHGTIVGRIEDALGRPVPNALLTFHRAAAPDRYWREAWTYPADRAESIGVDEVWHENYAMGDVPVGEYVVYVRIEDRLYARRVAVAEGEVVALVIRAQAEPDRLETGYGPALTR